MAGLSVSAIESGDDQRQLWAEQHQPYAARNHVLPGNIDRNI